MRKLLAMKYADIMRELEEMGTEQNRKVYPRHGVKPPLFGVSYAHLGKLRKRIKTDHSLAVQLWESGVHDARVLASMVAETCSADDSLLDRWVADLGNYVLTGAFSGYVSRTHLARAKAEEWIDGQGEWTQTAGWNIVASKASEPEPFSEKMLASLLKRIEEKIHRAENRVRYSMNNSLIAIGLRSEALKKKAQAAAKRIGPVKVDHGETGCRTPDAGPYIEKAWARRRK